MLPRGTVYRAGDRLAAEGVRLSPALLGVLAAAGAATVRAIPRPRVAIVPTGDELVDFRQVPGPGRIRNSNAVMLAGLVEGLASETWTSPILRDDPGALRDGLTVALERDVALVMGGVSAGQKDLVPHALEALEVRPVFHKIRIKPGKPLWFGVGSPRDGRPGPLVFGLPGNPLSVLVNFLVFVRPALRILAGGAAGDDRIEVRLASAVSHRNTLTTHIPARFLTDGRGDGGPVLAEALGWGGSADLLSAALADGFLILPEARSTYEAGEIVGCLPLR
jgi:molybdopterin molybdotransferase